jgi:phage gp29-like protein
VNEALLRAAKKGDVPAMKALADSLEERGDTIAAAAWRAKAGLCRVVYQVVNTETGGGGEGMWTPGPL